MSGQNGGLQSPAGTRGRPRGQPGRVGLERGLDGGGEVRGLRVDGDVPAEQHAADDLPGAPGCHQCLLYHSLL